MLTKMEPTNTPRRINVAACNRFIRVAKLIPAWFSSVVFERRWSLGQWAFSVRMRRADGFMGRFGGGWDWKLGFQTSTPSRYGWTIILSLLVAEASASYQPKEKPNAD